MSNNKFKIDNFFDKYSSEYSIENYNKNINKVMLIRLKTIIEFVEKNFNDKNIRILDLGCGSGEIALELAKLGYKGDALDNSKGMLEICKKKISDYGWNFYLNEAQNTHLENNKYDLIIASGLIEYYPEDNILLEEISRLLKKNGHLIINVTNKYGYSTCLNSFTYYIKQNFIFKIIKSKLFKFKYGIVNFSTRKHNIKKFKETLKQFNYTIKQEKYIGFSLFPAPFMTLFNFFTRKIDLKLETLSNTKIKVFGASYVVLCRKD
tara:strand:+ start:1148 stop:1939 length:792 start_codon:yes stop_codon:yes gene_type:complete